MTEAELLAQLSGWAFAFVLTLARVGCACMLLPGVGEAEIPMTVRAGAAVAFTALLTPVVAAELPAAPPDVLRSFAMVAAEIVTGLWLGWLARLVLLALSMAGQIAAALLGLSNVLQPDALGAQTSALSRLLGLAAPTLVLASGLYVLPMRALAGSFALIAPGALLPAADTLQTAVAAVAASFALAVQLASPFVLAAIAWHVASGLVSRLVPQLQVYFAAMPGQIVGGLALLVVLVTAIVSAWSDQAATALAALPGQ